MSQRPDHSTTNKTFILAAGGTGGHLFPALALADALHTQGHKIIIATDERGIRFRDEKQAPYEFKIISSGTFKSGVIGKLQTLRALGQGVVQSAKLFKSEKPDAVIGFGGYPAFPPLFTAQILKIPNVIHEANGVLGKANRYLAASATRIAISLPTTKGVTDHKKFKKKAILTGNPVRPNMIARHHSPYPDLDEKSSLRIFIMGGSQGARIFSDILPKAFGLMPDQLKSRLEIIQQCRPEDIERTQQDYNKAQIRARLKSFFDDAPEQLAACHLFIGRSGASTVSDVAVVGRPAIFVPLEHADNQQKLNAAVMADNGGAWVIPQDAFKPETLAARLEGLFAMPENLKAAATKAAEVGQPDAAQNLARTLIEIIKKCRIR